MKFGHYVNIYRIFKQLAKALVSLPVCAGWSEPLLVVHTTLLEITCRVSYMVDSLTLAGDKKTKVHTIVKDHEIKNKYTRI